MTKTVSYKDLRGNINFVQKPPLVSPLEFVATAGTFDSTVRSPSVATLCGQSKFLTIAAARPVSKTSIPSWNGLNHAFSISSMESFSNVSRFYMELKNNRESERKK